MGTEDLLSGLQRIRRDTDESYSSTLEVQEWLESHLHKKYFVKFESSAPSLRFHTEASNKGSQRDVFQYNFETDASTILQTNKQQTQQSHAFYMILRRSNSEQNLTVSSP